MRLVRTDLVPVVAIIAGGAVGVLTSGLALLARSDYVPPDPLVVPAPITKASAPPPLIYIDGVRISIDATVPPLESWLRGENAFTASTVRSALDQWLEVTGTSPLMIDGVQGIEVVSGDAAAQRYGDEASGGVILISLRPGALRPAPSAEPDISLVSMSARYTVAPQVLNIAEVRRAMFAAFPASVRNGEIGGTATVYFLIDEHGEVQDTRIDRTSGHEAVDEAALTVARVFRFSAALNDDQPVSVWVTHAMTFDVR